MTPIECWAQANKKLTALRRGLSITHDRFQANVYEDTISGIMKLLDEGLETFEQAALDDIRKNGT